MRHSSSFQRTLSYSLGKGMDQVIAFGSRAKTHLDSGLNAWYP